MPFPASDAWFSSESGLFTTIAGGVAAVADGDPVGRWEDRSGNARHAVAAADNASRPNLKLAIQNGRSVIRSNVTDLKRLNVPLSGASAYSLYFVAAPTSLAVGSFVSDWRNTGNGTPVLANVYFDTEGRVRHRVRNDAGVLIDIFTPAATVSAGQFVIIRATWNGTTLGLKVNDLTEITGAFSGSTTVNQLRIGNDAGSNNDHGEVLAFGSVLSAADDAAVRDRLSWWFESGPFCVEAAGVYVPGGTAAMARVAGAAAAGVYVPGAVAAQGGCE